ncbi:histidine kinase [Nocardioides sp. W7]|uniref:sensor histidine kinase n=1 Tax=Nocardioides sp. W7 TaxID=2931390 RepID=UPI001FD60913|nr:histidine kinase [Nocardioides sp. W7]
MSSRRWRSWADRDQVDRVDLYTRQSLYVLLWSFTALTAVQASHEVPAEDSGLAVAVAVGGFVVTLAAHRVLSDVIALYPAYRPLPWRSLGPFLGLSVVGFLVVLTLPTEVRGFGVMLLWSAAAWSLVGLRGRRTTAAVLVVLAAAPALAAREPWFLLGGLAIALFVLFTVRASLWLLGVVRELDRARATRSALAVAEERLRFSRDVHDVLGRRLSAIALQAELGAKLARRGDPAAADRMLEVREVAHEALREARELARGYSPTDLAQELEGARSLLRSAGIEVALDVEDLPAELHEPAGWVVREAVTNVLRHSEATRVVISYDGAALRVANDRPTAADGGDGTGLSSLATRLAGVGATLEVEGGEDRFAVVVRLSDAGVLR